MQRQRSVMPESTTQDRLCVTAEALTYRCNTSKGIKALRRIPGDHHLLSCQHSKGNQAMALLLVPHNDRCAALGFTCNLKVDPWNSLHKGILPIHVS